MGIRIRLAENWSPARILRHYVERLPEQEQQELRNLAERFKVDGTTTAALKHAVLAGIVFASDTLSALITTGSGAELFEIIETG